MPIAAIRIPRHPLVPAAMGLALAAAPVRANDYTVWPQHDYTMSTGQVLTVPDDVGKVRGVWVGEGLGADHDQSVLLRMWHFAKLGYAAENRCETKDCMDKELQEAAKASGHPEIAGAAFLAEGGSRNSPVPQWIATWYPDRTIAYHIALGMPDVGGTHIPRIFDVEEGRTGDAIQNLATTMSAWRSKGEPVCYVPMWGWGHGAYSQQDIVWAFFEECINLRLQPDGSLKDIAEASGWLGDPSTWYGEWPAIAKYPDYKGDKAMASWMPTERIAWIWQAYVSKHPTLTNGQSNWGTKHVGGSGGSFLDLSAPPSVCTNAPMRPYDLDKTWGWQYLFAARDSVIKIQITQQVGYDSIAKIDFYDAQEPIASPALSPLRIWTVPASFSRGGVHSIIVHLTRAGGQRITSRPATFFVDPDRAGGQARLAPPAADPWIGALADGAGLRFRARNPGATVAVYSARGRLEARLRPLPDGPGAWRADLPADLAPGLHWLKSGAAAPPFVR